MSNAKGNFTEPAPGATYAVWLSGTAFAAVAAWLWPMRVIVRGDDFGYMESLVETIRRGALTPSHWVEPLNMILPLLSGAIWRIGDSFYLATIGLTAALALLNFLLLWLWLRPLLPVGWAGNVAVLAAALFPTCLNKAVEYTGIPLGFSFFLGALLAWRRRKAGWFFALVLVGSLNRQSMVCLLMLPAVEQFCTWRRGGRPDGRWIVGGLGVGALLGAVMMSLPENLSRALTARHQQDISPWQFGGQVLLGVGLLGGIAACWAWLRGEPRVTSVRRTLTQPGPVLAWLALGGFLFAADITGLRCETPWLWRYGPAVVFAALIVAATVPRALGEVAPEALAAVAVYGVLVSWRGVWWDYYLCEPAWLLACSRARRSDGGVSGWLAAAVSGLGLGAALLWLYPLKQQLQWSEVRVVAYEKALRAEQIRLTEVSEAPFGFLGWKVFPALTEQAAAPGLRLSDFVKYVEAGRSYYGKGTIVSVPPSTDRRSLHGSGELWLLPKGYRPRKFPLNDTEWHDWLMSPAP